MSVIASSINPISYSPHATPDRPTYNPAVISCIGPSASRRRIHSIIHAGASPSIRFRHHATPVAPHATLSPFVRKTPGSAGTSRSSRSGDPWGQDIIDGSSKAFPRRRAPRDAPGSGPLPRFAGAPAKRRNRSVHAHSSFRVGMHQAPHDLRVFRRHSQIIPPRVEKPLDGPPIQGQDVIDQHHAGEHERPQAIAVVGAGRSPPAGQSSGRESRRCQRQTGRRACEADGFSPPGREALSRREAAVSIVDHPAVLVTPVRQDVGTVVPVQRIAKKLK